MRSDEAVTGPAFRAAIGKAIASAEARKASKDSCPVCRARLALLTLSFRGLKLGYLCRNCDHTSFDGRVVKKVDLNRRTMGPKSKSYKRRK